MTSNVYKTRARRESTDDMNRANQRLHIYLISKILVILTFFKILNGPSTFGPRYFPSTLVSWLKHKLQMNFHYKYRGGFCILVSSALFLSFLESEVRCFCLFSTGKFPSYWRNKLRISIFPPRNRMSWKLSSFGFPLFMTSCSFFFQ